MKFKINRDFFSVGLQQVLNVVSTRATMPILSNVLIEAGKDTIALTTTNLDLGIRLEIKAQVEQQGKITLPVRKLASIVKALPSLDVQIESTDKQAKITSGSSLFRIMGLAAEEFPVLPALDKQQVFKLEQSELLQMLKNIAYAQSGDENRYILNGVYFSFNSNKLVLVATDGRRLGMAAKEIQVKDENQGEIIVPAKTVAELLRLLGQGEFVNLTFSDRQVAFLIDIDSGNKSGLGSSIYLVSKIVEGKFPDYNQVIPKETQHRIKIERELMQECVQRAAIVTNDKNNSIKMAFKNNLLEISGASPELGEAHESIAISYEGPDVQIAFNPQFLLDPLKALTKDEVYFEFKDELSPGVFKTLDNFLCVIMPLRLS